MTELGNTFLGDFRLSVTTNNRSTYADGPAVGGVVTLNAVLGYTELITDHAYGEVPEKVNEVLDRMQKSGRHLLGLINDVAGPV